MLMPLLFSFCEPKQQKEESVEATSAEANSETVKVVEQQKTLITPQELVALKKAEPEIQIVDVRTPNETAQGIIEGAINIDYNGSDFAEKMQGLDKSKKYVIYCAAGSRSGRAFKLMQKWGFENVIDLQGGMNAWRGANLPVVNP